MDGFGFYKRELKDKSLYDKFKDKIKFPPGSVVIAKKSPAGIYDQDLKNSVFVVFYVCLHLDKSDGMEDDEEQPDNLPFYYCRNRSWDELVFDESELEMATTPQIINLLKTGLLANGCIPSRWDDKYYKANKYK